MDGALPLKDQLKKTRDYLALIAKISRLKEELADLEKQKEEEEKSDPTLPQIFGIIKSKSQEGAKKRIQKEEKKKEQMQGVQNQGNKPG